MGNKKSFQELPISTNRLHADLPERGSKYTFCITRIIGNELPPRDLLHSKTRALEFILKNEPNFTSCSKIWILNHIISHDYRRELIALLESFNQYYIEIIFNFAVYKKLTNFWDKVRYTCNINKARNLALKLGQSNSIITFSLDGDCFFTEKVWKEVSDKIICDIKTNNIKYYTIPSKRIDPNIQNWSNSYKDLKEEEEMLAFRADAELLYNEDISFSQDDKRELLYRVKNEIFDNCRQQIGQVLHVSFSDKNLEEDNQLRMKYRQESLEVLINSLDQIAADHK